MADDELQALREVFVQQAAREEQVLADLARMLEQSRAAVIAGGVDEIVIRQLEHMAVQRAAAEAVHRASEDCIRAMDDALRV